MSKSTSSRQTGKAADRPTRPHADFPLFPHGTGRWAKKVRGKLQYFGKVADDPKGQAAIGLWLDQTDDQCPCDPVIACTPSWRAAVPVLPPPCVTPLALYRPRDPQALDLWRLMDQHFDTFLATLGSSPTHGRHALVARQLTEHLCSPP